MAHRKDYFFEGMDRYAFDFGECSADKGYAQMDTSSDASYFGIWANPDNHKVVYFAEGDLSITVYDDDAEFTKGIRDMIDRMADYATFKGIDPGFNEESMAKWEALGFNDWLH